MDKINLPKSYDEVFFDQFIALKELDLTESSYYMKNISRLAILTDTLEEDEVWEDLDVEELSVMIKGLHWLKQEPSKDFSRKIDNLTFKEINKISFGEFIDLEYYFSINYHLHLPEICAILYRKTKLDEWGNAIFEPYDNINIDERKNLFNELHISKIYGVINEYLNFKIMINDTYKNLFEITLDESELDEEPEAYNEEEQAEIAYENKIAKWSWENVLNKLSNGDLTKYDEITNLSIIFVMNQLSYRKDMDI